MPLNAHLFYSNGKLLLTGEYVVLDGALSLALPTTYGQYLTVKTIKKPMLIWKSADEKDNVWFNAELPVKIVRSGTLYSDKNSGNTSTALGTSSDKNALHVLLRILSEAKKLNPSFLEDAKGFEISTKLTFPRHWGLGSSSTLVNNIAQWANVDAYQLLWNSIMGSGYDIACAKHSQPILYQLKHKKPQIKEVPFFPLFKARLYFIHLNQKQSSSSEIQRYTAVKKDKNDAVKAITNITEKMIKTFDLYEFESLIEEHERLISSLIKLPTIKEKMFNDYFGKIKSLGAWGGDFILATGDEKTPEYFKHKGFTTIIPYHAMVLTN